MRPLLGIASPSTSKGETACALRAGACWWPGSTWRAAWSTRRSAWPASASTRTARAWRRSARRSAAACWRCYTLAGALRRDRRRAVGPDQRDRRTRQPRLRAVGRGPGDADPRRRGPALRRDRSAPRVFTLLHHTASSINPYHWLFVIGGALMLVVLVPPQSAWAGVRALGWRAAAPSAIGRAA